VFRSLSWKKVKVTGITTFVTKLHGNIFTVPKSVFFCWTMPLMTNSPCLPDLANYFHKKYLKRKTFSSIIISQNLQRGSGDGGRKAVTTTFWDSNGVMEYF
jgi:hypothetical protein